MPLNKKGKEIMANMKKEYGSRAKEVFYASKNKGVITGVENKTGTKSKATSKTSSKAKKSTTAKTTAKKKTATKRPGRK